jgi:hypothetical protein
MLKRVLWVRTLTTRCCRRGNRNVADECHAAGSIALERSFSRIHGTHRLEQSEPRPRVLVTASAAGYYGARSD